MKATRLGHLSREMRDSRFLFHAQREPSREPLVGDAGESPHGRVDGLRPYADAGIPVDRDRVPVEGQQLLPPVGHALDAFAFDDEAAERKRADRRLIEAMPTIVVWPPLHLAPDDHHSIVAAPHGVRLPQRVIETAQKIGDGLLRSRLYHASTIWWNFRAVRTDLRIACH